MPARHVCAREVVDSTAGQCSVMILVARILLVQKADAAGFVWTLTGIKVCPMPRVFRLSDRTCAVISQFYGVYSSAQRLCINSAVVRKWSPHSGRTKTVLKTQRATVRSTSRAIVLIFFSFFGSMFSFPQSEGCDNKNSALFFDSFRASYKKYKLLLLFCLFHGPCPSNSGNDLSTNNKYGSK